MATGLPRVPWHLALGEDKNKKNPEPSPSALATGTRGRIFKKKNEFLPRVLHSGKSSFP
jgi:hypothetical protein